MGKILYLLLAAIILSSACIGAGKSRTQVESRDLVVVNSYDFFPSQSIQPGDNLVVRMEIENVGQIKTAIDLGDSQGNAILYDFCKGLYQKTEDVTIIGAEVAGSEWPQIDLDVGKLAIVQWTLKAPTKEQLLNLNHECIFKFKVNYNASAQTNTFVYFASPLEIAQRIYTKDDLKFKGDNIATFGPVAINFETPAQPISADGSKSWTFFVNVRNVGSGIAYLEGLEIQLPKTYSVQESDLGTSCQAFELDSANNRLILSDEKPEYLRISSQTTSRIPCSLKTPPNVTILQPFQFVSAANYTYSVREQQVVNVGREGV